MRACYACAQQQSVDWTLVGPEAPLAAGIVDAFRAAGLADLRADARGRDDRDVQGVFEIAHGRRRRAHGPRGRHATTSSTPYRAIDELGAPVVIKASGLAAGKGVIVCATAGEARAAASSMLDGTAFGDAGATILVEEFMEGEELSVFVLTDGRTRWSLPAAQDHKRLLDGDRGPNTGGMGAYAPVSIAELTRR